MKALDGCGSLPCHTLKSAEGTEYPERKHEPPILCLHGLFHYEIMPTMFWHLKLISDGVQLCGSDHDGTMKYPVELPSLSVLKGS